MKEPDFFINKAQSIIDELNKFDLFELDEEQRKAYFLNSKFYYLFNDKFNNVKDLSKEKSEAIINQIESDLFKLKELKFQIKILFNEIDNNNLFLEKFENDTELKKKEFNPLDDTINMINKKEVDYCIFILDRFIDYIKEYRK
ncbi:hypothetical protein [Empedobacter falsenii]